MDIILNNENLKNIDLFIKDFIARLKAPNSVKKYTISENLIYISELLNSDYEDKQLIDDANIYIEQFANGMKSSNYKRWGMFSELGMFAFAVDTIYKKTGDLEKLTTSLNNMLLEYGNYIVSNTRNTKINMSIYDCISGVSGVVYYLLNTKTSMNYRKELCNMIDYLIYLTKHHKYKGKDVINYHIENESLGREDERYIFKDGVINFGLAHGMSGVLSALSKAYELQIYNDKDKILDAIDVILKIYEKYVLYSENIPLYPTQLDFSDYTNNNVGKLRNACSWCYGNISNELVLTKTYEILKDCNNYNIHKNNLINIINQNDSMYNLPVPVLCHGYASVVAEQVSMYKKSKDKDLIKYLDRNISEMLNLYNKINEKYPEIKSEDLDAQIGLSFVQGHRDDLSLLCGSGGIFLSLLSVIGNTTCYESLLMID